MNDNSSAHNQLCALADYLTLRRGEILSAWRLAVDNDAEMTTASAIPHHQFVDHVPAVLDAFEHRLRATDFAERAEAVSEEKISAGEHGLHRWQQGYDLPETMREWGHLQLCLLSELERYASQHAELLPGVMPIALRALMRLCGEGVSASAARFVMLLQAEASTRVRELEAALAELQILEQQRANVWREAAHDLRGSAHVISNVSAALAMAKNGLTETTQKNFSEILGRGVASLNQLLADLMDHARLEAGQEQRSVTKFDAAAMLKEFCDSVRPAASERNLFLKSEGPQPFIVEGDAVKIKRVVQNLVLNALKATERGGIKVTWEGSGSESRPQWMLCVQDTGPGFKSQSASSLEKVLKRATIESNAIEERGEAENHLSTHIERAPTLPSQTRASAPPSGDGIGLSIVKRLCELLDASLELETAEGRGTTFRVIFPRKY